MKKLLGVFLVLFIHLSMLAQQRTVSGVIRDEKGDPIPFATVTISGTKTAVQANENGSFVIKADAAATFHITATGYEQRSVTEKEAASVTLVRSANTQLQEVVVTALGIQRQRKELGYATAKVGSAELNRASPLNAAVGLQGKVSGLNITTVNNGVFADVKINLRGIRSLMGNNNPMLLLDGVPTPLSYISSINPNDVQDVTVLKGASGAGLYGTDARNGVIVITTKKGGRGTAPVITLSHSTQLEQISFFPEMQDEFGPGGYGAYIPYENWSWGDAYDGSVRQVGRRLEDGTIQELVYSPLKNEKKKMFNTGITNQTNLSFGTKDFYMSLQDANVKGIVPGDKNRRTGIRLNSSKEYGKFRASLNVNYIQQNYQIFDQQAMEDYHVNNGVGLNGGLLNLIFNTPAHIPLTSYKNFQTDKFAKYNNYFNDYGLNPYFAMDNWRQTGKSDDLITNIDLNLKATNWLTLTYRAAMSMTSVNAEAISKGEVASEYAQDLRSFTSIPGAVTESNLRRSRISSEFVANAQKTFDDFKVNFIAGQYFRHVDYTSNSVGANNLVVPELFNVGNRASELSGDNYRSKNRLIGLYGTVGLSYKGWVNVEVSGRNDWSSVLAKGQNSYFYPGVNASLVVSDAVEAVRSSAVISYLKLRGSIQKIGNTDIDPYSLDATFSQGLGFPFGPVPGYAAGSRAYDPLLRPEFTTSKEVGFEIGFFKNRLNIELAYYQQNNTNQVIPISVSNATGHTSYNINAASFTNKGLELDLKLTPLVKFPNGSIDIKANASYNTSTVNRIYDNLDRVAIPGGFSNAANYAIKGSPAFVLMATDYLRDDQGRVIVDRETGLPTIDPNLKQFGRTLPIWIVGINPSIEWKGFQLSAVAEYKGGHYAYHQIGSDMAWTGVSKATAINHRERFVIPNSVYDDGSGKYVPNTDVVVSNVNNYFTTQFRGAGSNFITSAAAWRIREVSLGYTIPRSVLGKQNVIKSITVGLTARNLALFLPKTNEFTDPDFNNTIGNSSGINTSKIQPPTRIYGGNISITF